MQHRAFRKILIGGLIALSVVGTGAVVPAEAQTPPSRVGTTGGGGLEGADNPLDDGRGSNLSWIGLLGLAGLLGLRGRKKHHDTPYVDTTTTGGASRRV